MCVCVCVCVCVMEGGAWGMGGGILSHSLLPGSEHTKLLELAQGDSESHTDSAQWLSCPARLLPCSPAPVFFCQMGIPPPYSQE